MAESSNNAQLSVDNDLVADRQAQRRSSIATDPGPLTRRL
jgi:hypothetical protein